MGFTTLDDILWAAGFMGHVLLLCVLVRWSRWRSFPVFTALVGYEALVTITLFVVSQSGTAHRYFVCYWTLALIDYVFQIALLVEVARNVFPGSARWVYSWTNGVVILTIIGVLLASCLCLLVAPPGMVGLDLWEERITLFTSLLTCELYVGISLRANLLRLQWQDHVMAIGQGLALWSGAAVLGDVLHAIVGWNSGVVFFDHFRMVVYLGDLIYWTWVFSKPEQAPSFCPAKLQRVFANRYGPDRPL